MATSIGVCAARTYHTELLVGPQSVGSSLAAVALEVSMLSVNRGVVILVAFLKGTVALRRRVSSKSSGGRLYPMLRRREWLEPDDHEHDWCHLGGQVEGIGRADR